MSTGNVLYLLMCIGVFASFAIVLAYQSWQQSKLGSEMIKDVPAGDRHVDHDYGQAVHI